MKTIRNGAGDSENSIVGYIVREKFTIHQTGKSLRRVNIMICRLLTT
jgi:hypothetical protein